MVDFMAVFRRGSAVFFAALLAACAPQAKPTPPANTTPTATASSERSPDHKNCFSSKSDKGYSPTRALQGCDAIIKSGTATGKYLAKIHNNRGVEYQRRGDADLAETDYRTAVSINPSYVLGWYNLSKILHKQQRYEEAVAAATSTIAADDGDARGYRRRARSLRELGRYPEARQDLEVAFTINPDDAWTHRESGYLYADNGEFELGLAALRKGYELDPDNTSSQYGLAYGLDDVGRYREALVLLDKSIATEQTVELRNLRGLIYSDRSEEVRNLPRAIDDLRWVIAADEKYAYAYYNLSRAYAHAGQNEDALRLLRRGLNVEVRRGQAQDIIKALRANGAQPSAVKAGRLLADAEG